ncbi:hypothetical protein HGRIS_008379 [Hohenbuehelia grisea]|uniref:Uncharacterized protein n=1 Tax=Hohenbuehelia grisea TaxID=104357 RepID=A0ABR3J7S7_9AGAR
MTADQQTFGFPPGYFVIRSVASNRLLDVANDAMEDGEEIILWPEKDSSLVESRRLPEANNQVFFIDTSGALCSRSAGHAVDIEGNKLVLRHRRPMSFPFPNAYSHPLPKFSYDNQTGEITVHFEYDPSFPENAATAWQRKTYVLASIPLRKPRTMIDDASDFFVSNIGTPLTSLFSGKPTEPARSTLDEVFNSDIDLKEDEVLEEERGEETEVDDSSEQRRNVRMLAIVDKLADDKNLNPNARNRRRWQISSLRTSNARTGAI